MESGESTKTYQRFNLEEGSFRPMTVKAGAEALLRFHEKEYLCQRYTLTQADPSSRKEIWDVTQRGINDWDLLNTERNGNSHGLDLRVDKRWYFKKWALNAYLDIQNIYNFKTETQSFLDVVRDENGDPIEDPTDPERYLVREIENTTGTVLPSIGIMIEF